MLFNEDRLRWTDCETDRNEHRERESACNGGAYDRRRPSGPYQRRSCVEVLSHICRHVLILVD